MEALILPLLDMTAVPDDDLEVGVEKENNVGLESVDVQMYGVRVGVVEGILQESGLNHDQGIGGVFPEKSLFVVLTFIG